MKHPSNLLGSVVSLNKIIPNITDVIGSNVEKIVYVLTPAFTIESWMKSVPNTDTNIEITNAIIHAYLDKDNVKSPVISPNIKSIVELIVQL